MSTAAMPRNWLAKTILRMRSYSGCWLGLLAVAVRARHLVHVFRRQLLARRDHGAADEALHRLGRLQLRIERGAVVEHEAVARVVGAADFLEVLEDAAYTGDCFVFDYRTALNP